MNTIVKLFIFSLFLLVISCEKGSSTYDTIPKYCYGLITDTAGRGDTSIIFIPNAITPNGDNLNDSFCPVTLNINSYEFTIYDSNYNVVFVSDTQHKKWSTSLSSQKYNIFYYKIQFITDGNNKIGKCGEIYVLKCFPKELPMSILRFEDEIIPYLGFVLPSQEPANYCP